MRVEISKLLLEWLVSYIVGAFAFACEGYLSKIRVGVNYLNQIDGDGQTGMGAPSGLAEFGAG